MSQSYFTAISRPAGSTLRTSSVQPKYENSCSHMDHILLLYKQTLSSVTQAARHKHKFLSGLLGFRTSSIVQYCKN
jgi:hypothetical protein